MWRYLLNQGAHCLKWNSVMYLYCNNILCHSQWDNNVILKLECKHDHRTVLFLCLTKLISTLLSLFLRLMWEMEIPLQEINFKELYILLKRNGCIDFFKIIIKCVYTILYYTSRRLLLCSIYFSFSIMKDCQRVLISWTDY